MRFHARRILPAILVAPACTSVLGIDDRKIQVDGSFECYEGCRADEGAMLDCNGCTTSYHEDTCNGRGLAAAFEANAGYEGCRPKGGGATCSACTRCLERCLCDSTLAGATKTEETCRQECGDDATLLCQLVPTSRE